MIKEERVGNSRRNLVFETASSIRVLIGDKYYTLNFKDAQEQKDNGAPVESSFIISQNMMDYINGNIEYPGDGKIIFALSDGIYYTYDGAYYPLGADNSSEDTENNQDEFNDTIIFHGSPAFKVDNNTLIENLNAQLLNGKTYEDLISELSSNQSKVSRFSELYSEDGKFSYSGGVLRSENISSKNIETDVLKFESLDGDIIIGINSTLEIKNEFNDAKLGINYGISLLEKLYNLYRNNEIITESTFTDLAKSLLTPVNNDWNFIANTEEALNQICYSGLLHKAINVDNWKTINTTDGNNLYNKILKYVSDEDYSTEYDGAVYSINVSNINGFYTGYKLTGIAENDSGNLEVKFIVTGIDKENDTLYVRSNANTFNYQHSELSTESIEIVDGTETCIINIESYKVPDGIVDEEDLYGQIEFTPITDKIGVIGSLNNVNDEVFGQLEGKGIWLSQNGIFRNVKLAQDSGGKVYIKIDPANGGFFGLNDEGQPWIVINPDGTGEIKTSKYTLKSDGTLIMNELSVPSIVTNNLRASNIDADAIQSSSINTAKLILNGKELSFDSNGFVIG